MGGDEESAFYARNFGDASRGGCKTCPEKHLTEDSQGPHFHNASFRNSANGPRDGPQLHTVLGVGDRKMKKYDLCSLFWG